MQVARKLSIACLLFKPRSAVSPQHEKRRKAVLPPMTTILRNNLYRRSLSSYSEGEAAAIERRIDYANVGIGLEAKPRERLMPRTFQEQLDCVERDIKLHIEFEKAEKARFDRESYLWTAEDRIEWQEEQTANARYLRELLEERAALRIKLGLA